MIKMFLQVNIFFKKRQGLFALYANFLVKTESFSGLAMVVVYDLM